MATIGRIFLCLAGVLGTCVGISEEPKAKPAEKPRPAFTISKETTRITEPLRPDGYPDFVALENAEMSRGVTPENNAAMLLVRAIGPKPIPEDIREQFFKMLGIDALKEDEKRYFIALSDFWETDAKERSDQLNTALSRPWTEGEFPEIAAWLDQNAGALKLVVEAVKRPKCYFPKVGENVLDMVLIESSFREVATSLTASGMLKLSQGKLEEARQDFLACHRLASHIGNDPLIVDALIAHRIRMTANRGDLAIPQFANLSKEQIVRLQKDRATLPNSRPVAEAIDQGERFLFLDTVRIVSQEGVNGIRRIQGGDTIGFTEFAKTWGRAIDAVLVDWNRVVAFGNRWYDRLVIIYRMPVGSARRSQLSDFKDDLRSMARDFKKLPAGWLTRPRKTASDKLGTILCSLLLAGLTDINAVETTETAESNLVDVGLALAAYQADHDRYPDELKQLVPKYLAAVPVDVFSDDGDELIYEQKGVGYLLYSVGKNGHDDGGKNREDRPDDESLVDCDDIALRVLLPKQ